MCCKKQNNIDLSSCLQHLLLLLLPDISDPYLIQRAQPLHGYHDDPCSWGGESWSFCSDVVSRDRQQCGKEEGGGRRGKGRRGRPQSDPPEAAESQTEGTSLSCCFLPVLLASWAIRSPLLPVSLLVNCSPPSLFLSLLSSQCHSLQLLRLMSFFDRILSMPACWFLPLRLNKCKHGEGLF